MAGERHPKGLYILFFTEMWERFSFYLMIGILPLYLTDKDRGLGWTQAESAVVTGSYGALVYFTPFIGGLIADRLLGFRITILIGGTLMMIGHIVLALPTELGLYLGLLFLILGNGAFKPNISTLLGNLYPPGSPLKDSGYSIFYLGINIGGFICNFVANFVRNYFNNRPDLNINGWHAAFATAGVGMFIGLVIFAANYRRFGAADPDPRTRPADQTSLAPFWIKCLIPAVACGTLGWFLPWIYNSLPVYVVFLGEEFPLDPHLTAFLVALIPVIAFYINIWSETKDPGERGRVGALLVVFGTAIVFWMTFYLNTSALTFWAQDNTTREPGPLVSLVTDNVEDFAEEAPPGYFSNAGPEVPRPHKSSYRVVSQEEFQKLKKENKLSVEKGEKPYITQQSLDLIYKGAVPGVTPILPEGKQLPLANTELFQSINSGFVILFTPLVVGIWHFLRARGKEPSTPAKLGIGLILTAGSPLIMLMATRASGDGVAKVSAWWLFGTYAIITLGELCLSPMGLALVSKLAPARIAAFMMGGWFVATAIGAKLAGIAGQVYNQWDHYVFWRVLIVCNLFFAAFIFALLPWLKRQMTVEKPAQPEAPGWPEGPALKEKS